MEIKLGKTKYILIMGRPKNMLLSLWYSGNKRKGCYYPPQILPLAFMPLARSSHHLQEHSVAVTQGHDFLASYPCLYLKKQVFSKALRAFLCPAAPLFPGPPRPYFSISARPPLSGTFKPSPQLSLYAFKHVQFSPLLENILLTQLPSPATAVNFIPFAAELLR